MRTNTVLSLQYLIDEFPDVDFIDSVKKEKAWLRSLCPQPKQEWTEEDKENIESIKIILRKALSRGISCEAEILDLTDWLKSLHPQSKAEWSEEDRTIIEGACNALEIHGHAKLASMLKSLCPSWKPSEEQMTVFQNTMQRLLRAGGTGKWYAILESLYEQLKKL